MLEQGKYENITETMTHPGNRNGLLAARHQHNGLEALGLLIQENIDVHS